MLRSFLRVSDSTSWLAETLAVILLYAFCGLMLAEVFSRSFLSSSIALSWEFSSFAMAGVFMLGAGPALRHGTHVRVSLVSGSLSPRSRRLLDIAATGAAIMLAVLLFSAFWSLFSTSWARGLRQTSHTNTPLIWPQALVVIGSAQFVLDLVAQLIRLFLNLPVTQPLPRPKDSPDA